jgi:aspartate kinase
MSDLQRRGNDVAGRAAKDVVVLKFGGTSVEDSSAIRRVVEIVHGRLHAKPIVVVSALAGVTDQLLALGNAAAQSKSDIAVANLLELRKRHQQVAGELVPADEFEILNQQLGSDFAALDDLLCGIASAGQLSPRAQDPLLGLGECLSSKIVTAALKGAGIAAALVDTRTCLITDSRHTHAQPIWEDTNLLANQILRPLLDESRVPVLGGFIAATRDGVPTTLGRGGSDLSAAIIGAALCAQRIEIWTDVDGIMTGDPNLCPDARLIERMSFDEAAELAHFGAKVLHPATLLPAMKQNIPVYVLNSRNPRGEGTEIVAHSNAGNAVRAVTSKRGVAAVEVQAPGHLDSELLGTIHEAFDRHHCPIDMMSSSRGRVSLLVGSTGSLSAVAADLQSLGRVQWENHKALVCLVGENIRCQPEVASRVFAAVSDMDVRVVCQGASDRTISFLVDEERAVESVQRLHALFFPEGKKEPIPSTLPGANALCQAGDAWS